MGPALTGGDVGEGRRSRWRTPGTDGGGQSEGLGTHAPCRGSVGLAADSSSLPRLSALWFRFPPSLSRWLRPSRGPPLPAFQSAARGGDAGLSPFREIAEGRCGAHVTGLGPAPGRPGRRRTAGVRLRRKPVSQRLGQPLRVLPSGEGVCERCEKYDVVFYGVPHSSHAEGNTDDSGPRRLMGPDRVHEFNIDCSPSQERSQKLPTRVPLALTATPACPSCCPRVAW